MSFFRFVKKLEHSWKALVHDGVISCYSFMSLMLSKRRIWCQSSVSRTPCRFTGRDSTQKDLRSLCASESLKRCHVSLIFSRSPGARTPGRLVARSRSSVLNPVKSSPSKKRRANGPVKKAVGFGPSLSAQSSISTQQPPLSAQVSCDGVEGGESNGGEQTSSITPSVSFTTQLWRLLLSSSLLLPAMQSDRPDLLPRTPAPSGAAAGTPTASLHSSPAAEPSPPNPAHPAGEGSGGPKDQENSAPMRSEVSLH